MGTAFAGIIRTPLTSVIMIFEVTRNYAIIVPLMISNLLAFYISQKFQRQPIYEALARQDGLHLPTGEARTVARHLRVSVATKPAPPPLAPDLSSNDAHDRVRGSSLDSWPVADGEGLLGMVRTADITAAVAEGRGSAPVRTLIDANGASEDRKETAPPHVHGDQPLAVALARMGATHHSVLPVVSRANVRTMLGIVSLPDILRAFGVQGADEVPELTTKDD
jgi:CIC family chloride channel protein